MARMSEDCRWCTWACGVAVMLVGWFAFVHGPAQPEQLRQRAEAAAGRDLATAGFPWARLTSQGETARLSGEAPSEEARLAASAAADVLLARFIGLPGVFARIEKQLTVAPRTEADRQALDNARQALARTDRPLDLPATGAGAAAPVNEPAVPPSPLDAASVAASAARAGAVAASAAGVVNVGNAAALGVVPGSLQRPDPGCQRELVRLQQGAPLRFRPAAATLEVGQDEAIEALARLLKRCSVGRVLVHGLREAPAAAEASTDAPASEAAAAPMGSLLLAQRRAQAVRAELIAHGVALNRLQIGAGAREVLGDTAARVELTLAPGDRP